MIAVEEPKLITSVSLVDITAVLLVGGAGTRLRPVVSDRPKSLAEIGGRPFLAFLLDELAASGLRRAVLCTGYLGDHVEAAFGSNYDSLSLTYSREPEPLGTAGALAYCAGRLGSDPVLVLNGDSYCETNLPAFLSWHLARKSPASLVLTKVPNVSRYGRVMLGAGGEIVRFEEKTAQALPTEAVGWINGGIYLLAKKTLSTLLRGRALSLEREVFPALVGQGLAGYTGGGRFLDVGTPASYGEAQYFFSKIRRTRASGRSLTSGRSRP